MNRKILSTIIVAAIGVVGVLVILYAWHLPPFEAAVPATENAYVRGRITSLAPQVAGYVAVVEVTDFQTVHKGDVIVRLDDRQPRQRVEQARASLAGAQAALAIGEQSVVSAEAVVGAREAALISARAAADTAQSTADRTSALRKRGIAAESTAEASGAALSQAQAGVAQAQAALATAKEDVRSARVALDARRADIAAAQAAVELAAIDLENTVIRAPEDGRLGQIGARKGQYVTAGSALAALVGPDVWVIANFKETSLHGMRLGQVARFTVDAMQHREFTGRVEAFSPATASEFSLINATNATGNFTKVAQRLPVRISIDPGQEMSEYLRPGMSVVVRVDVP
ncbi:HlyD family secretion protein [Paracoccus contaminans]|uniref:Hemolysin secretion protein D n=1 Tax=Paracoccus contaminans TaxID=1945662 RepID=A0A1W6D0B6_9RHOB|nr:HlyD family secretion protein [Paracoccus contaminans]ARJ70515.1 hemolysin secretion protein D [Paracoccus contaminans]